MRKAVMIVLALLAIRLLPGALRREARALELLAVLFQVTIAATAASSKVTATEQRTAALEKRVGTVQAGGGTVTNLAAPLSASQTGTPQSVPTVAQTATIAASGVTVTGTTSSGGPTAGTAHTHGIDHTHSYGHVHFTQLETSFNNLEGTVTNMFNALRAAGLI